MKFTKAVILVCLLSLVLAPVRVGAQLLGSFTIADEMRLGRQYDILLKANAPLIYDPEAVEYIDYLVQRLAAVVPPQPFRFQVAIIEDNNLNAFAVPGGYVFVHSGLILYLDHEADLAGVLAHEMAHVTQRHIAHSMGRGQAITLATLAGMLAGMLAGGGSELGQAMTVAAGAAGQAAALNYSRADESDADQTGLQYLVAAGFNPYGLNRSFSRLQEGQRLRGVNYEEYLSTHPDLNNRITALSARIQTLPLEVQQRGDDDTRLVRVQTLVWGKYGSLPNARQRFEAMDANDPLRAFGLALLAGRQRDVGLAQSLFEQALALAPADSMIWREAGIFQFNSGDDSQARSLLETALNLKPSDYLARFYLARLLDEQGQWSAAQAHYREVLLNLPEDVEVHNYYGRSLGYSGQEFAGYLHLAYAQLYANNDRQAMTWLERAKDLASSPAEQEQVKQFEALRKERREILK